MENFVRIRCLRGWIGAAIACAVLTGLPRGVRAAPGDILFLGLQPPSPLSDRASKQILRRMDRMGEHVVAPVERLSATDRACESQECLSALGADRRVDWILGGRLRGGASSDHLVSLWLYDVKSMRLLEQQVNCEGCGELEFGGAILAATGHLLEGRVDERDGSSTNKESSGAEAPPKLQPPSVIMPIAPEPELPRTSGAARKGLAALLGITGAIVLAGAIASTVGDVGGPCIGQRLAHAEKCSWRVPVAATGYAVGGLLLAGFVISVKLP